MKRNLKQLRMTNQQIFKYPFYKRYKKCTEFFKKERFTKIKIKNNIVLM